MDDFGLDAAPPSLDAGGGCLILKMLTKIWEQVLLLPAVQFCRWQNPFGRNQSISSCFVIVAGAEGNGRRQKNGVTAEPPAFHYPTKMPCGFGDK